ncbi:MAG: fatty acid desaturase family protein [Myxococcaceae bacterium]|nr:fatty acid desaturase family protein [Myxococcaceae bacterium]
METHAAAVALEPEFESDQRYNRPVDRKALAALTRELSRIRPAVALWALARQWIVIAACVAFVVVVDRWWAWPIAAFLIATRQHALLVLMHEGSHYHIVPNRTLNDIITDLFCSFPCNITTQGYRYQHGEHHRYVNTNQDPYWVIMQAQPAWHFPRTPLKAAAVFLGDVLGVYILDHLKAFKAWTYLSRLTGQSQPKISAAEHVRYWLFIGALVTTLTLTGGWLYYLLLWLVPQSTMLMAIFRLRSLGEHPLETTNTLMETRESRDVSARLLERVLISPLNINYHLTHHVFPSITFHNLPRMHEELKRAGIFVKGVNAFDVYFGRDEHTSVVGYITKTAPSEERAPAVGSP